MKILIALILAFAGLSQAQHHHHHSADGDRMAVHGMVVFGTTEKVYLSHLPLFSSPHNYQAIVEVSFNKEAQGKYTESLAVLGTKEDEKNLNKYHTIEPEAFVLPEKMKEGESFEARLVRGHFERANHKDVDMNVQVTVLRVLYFHKFDKDAKRDEKSRWLLFGNKEEQFAAHLVSQKPDFDQIFSGSVVGGVAKHFATKGALETTSELLNAPVVPADLSEGALSLTNGDKDVSFSKITEIYLETEELQ